MSDDVLMDTEEVAKYLRVHLKTEGAPALR